MKETLQSRYADEIAHLLTNGTCAEEEYRPRLRVLYSDAVASAIRSSKTTQCSVDPRPPPTQRLLRTPTRTNNRAITVPIWLLSIPGTLPPQGWPWLPDRGGDPEKRPLAYAKYDLQECLLKA